MLRRKLGKDFHTPLDELDRKKGNASVVFVVSDHETAKKTRVALCMYASRKGLNLTTHISENEVWVMKDKDYPGDVKRYNVLN